MSDWNTKIIAEFRANGGKVEQFGDVPLVILHTVGAKSGLVREIPLVVGHDGDHHYVVASKGGAPTHPDWYFNLKAHPEIDVELPDELFRARLDECEPEDAAAKIQALNDVMPVFSGYVEQAKPRVIPVFSIRRI